MSKKEVWWVLRAQCGDREALDALLRGLVPGLREYLHRLTGREDLADDLVQEVLLVICKKLKSLREPELFRPWSFRIASRLAFRHFRKEKRWRDLDENEVGQMADPCAEAAVTRRLETLSAAQLVDRLPPASRATLWLHYIQGLTLAEVAEVLEIPLGTAKSRLSYGIARLQKEV